MATMANPQTWVFHPNKGDLTGPVRESDQIRLTTGPDLTGDLSGFKSRKDLAQHLAGKFEKARAVGRLWSLAHDVRPGDRVLVPGIGEGGTASVGVVKEGYRFIDDPSSYRRHGFVVEWLSTDLDVEKLERDLKNRLKPEVGFLHRLDVHEASRVVAVLDGAKDPGKPGSFEQRKVEFLQAAADKASKRPHELKVRELLGHWGHQYRSNTAISDIQEGLAQFDLATEPLFTEGDIESRVRLVPADSSAPVHLPESLQDYGDTSVSAHPKSLALLIGALAVPSEPITVDTPLGDARHMMVERNFSQLAVVDPEERYLGAVTSDSIMRAYIATGDPKMRQALDRQAPCLYRHDHLLDQIGLIRAYGFAFVRSSDGKTVNGIVTAADLSWNFDTFIGPIVILEEIELRLRKAVDGAINPGEIRRSLREYRRKEVNRAADMFLGEYVVLLNKEEYWKRLGWGGYSQQRFLDSLSKVTRIRNAIMHFSTDRLTEEHIHVLEGLLRTLRSVQVDL